MNSSTGVLLIVATLAGGLAADVYTNIVGQTMIGLIVWLTLFSLLSMSTGTRDSHLMACLVIATAGEILLSLGWGLYTYRLGNIPLFVPPGHVLMLLLGFSLARRMPEAAALANHRLCGCLLACGSCSRSRHARRFVVSGACRWHRSRCQTTGVCMRARLC